MRFVRALRDRIRDGAGGHRLVPLLAVVYALQSADQSTVGATAPLLHRSLLFTRGEIGLLASTSAIVGVLATLPAGVLADRCSRVRLLRMSVGSWTVGMALVGAMSTFAWMLPARMLLGIVNAAAGPITASLIGDVVSPGRRGRVLSRLLLAQLIGTGTGVTVSGELGGLLGWRWAYWWLAAVGVAVTMAFRRTPEPPRRSTPRGGADADQQLSLWSAAVRVLRIRTNLVLVVASALGYYFFAGVATFGFSYLHSEFGISETTAPVIVLLLGGAAAAGVVTGGSVADRLRRRYRSGRVIAVLVAFGAAVVLLVPALAVSDLPISLPLLVAGAAMLGAANPPLDAARIDIVPRRLLGRAESIRTMLSSGVDVSAPAAFGFLGGSLGLSTTFLLMTIPLGLALGLGVIALRTYPADAAAAIESRPDDRMSPRQVSSRRESP